MTISIITTSNHTHLADSSWYMKTACGRRVDAPRRTDGALSPLRGLLGTADSRDAVTCRACRRSSAFHRADPARIELETSHADAIRAIEAARSILHYYTPSERELMFDTVPGAKYVAELDARLRAEADKRDAEANASRAKAYADRDRRDVGIVSNDHIGNWIRQSFVGQAQQVIYNNRRISFPAMSVAPEYRITDPWP